MKPYYKTSDGEVVELKQQDVSWLYSMNIVELIIPDGCIKVNCSNNQLKELIIPDGYKIIRCCNNKLKELVIPDECKRVWADMKSITELNIVDDLNLWI